MSIRIEEDLLTQAHHFYLIYQLAKPDPSKQYTGDVKQILNLSPIVIVDQVLDLRELIELSLEESLYNKVCFSEQNIQIFEVMRQIGRSKYGLNLNHSYIPIKSVEQGKIDVIALMKSFNIFVQRFKYNMFNQTFIELAGDSNKLKAVSIDHISDSINTHGLGIINTSVNAIYQFVVRYINRISQLMMDENLSSYLLREQRWLSKTRSRNTDEKVESRYPLERGTKFKEELSLFSIRENKINILDQFRIIITALGNSVGFARLLRISSFNYLSKNTEFIPFIENHNCSFGDTASVLNYGKTMKSSCVQLDKMINLMRENYSREKDYLRVSTFFLK